MVHRNEEYWQRNKADGLEADHQGMLHYGLQLVTVELCTIAAIYIIRLIIDYLHKHETPFVHYNWFLLLTFTLFRYFAILVRNYYDLHVYNYYRYV